MHFIRVGGQLKRAVLFGMIIAGFYNLQAQISGGGTPESFLLATKSTVKIPGKLLSAIDTAACRKLDDEQGISNRFGIVQQVYIDIRTQGVKTEIPGKGYIWRYKIQAPQAYSLGIQFLSYFLPENASVFIYNQDHSHLVGAFTNMDNNKRNNLEIAMFPGNSLIIEYFEPYHPAFEGELIVGAVSQAYRDILKAAATGIVGINCPEGANWQDDKHAVCLMTFHDTQYDYLCTGFLVNNVRQDGTPYFQTANHCISTNALAATLVTHFNFENSTCSSSDAISDSTISGATLLATNAYSDFTLLELTQYPRPSLLPFYAGWDATGNDPTSGTCIHHPEGLPKSISIDANAPFSYSQKIEWTDGSNVVTSVTQPNTHWEVDFTDGITESGSSGSPLFDQNHRVIGQLHGGSNNTSYFGKFSLSWNYGSTIDSQLKHWLDPDNTGTTVLNGTYLHIRPSAQFSVKFTNVCPGYPMVLSDQSKYLPTSWLWNITPAGYKFLNATGITSQNPEVEFVTPGVYTVSLKVINTNGTDSILKKDYITVGNIHVIMDNIPTDSILCGYQLNNYNITASGAETYTYSLERKDKMDYYVNLDTLNLSLKASEKKYGSFTTSVKVVGKLGTCTDADSALLNISMPVNDDIQNAVTLYPGRNNPYSNFCGSVQTNEPSPSLNDCYGTNSWCASGYSPQHTMWFNFVGPSSGKVTIDTHGFNDRIAVYRADSAGAVMSGIIGNYSIIAANDDRSATDNTARLTEISVDPGSFYWLQVDGYKGATGNCTIDLITNSLDLFPNPSSGNINLYVSNTGEGKARVEVFSMIGQLVYSNVFSVTPLSNHLSLDLSDLSSGLYVVRVTINGSTMYKKFAIHKI